MANKLRAPRVSGADLTRSIASATAGLPAATATASEKPTEKTMQINFRGSEGMARVLAELAVKHGSVRRAVAQLLRDAGHDVPDADFAPPPGRRRLG